MALSAKLVAYRSLGDGVGCVTEQVTPERKTMAPPGSLRGVLDRATGDVASVWTKLCKEFRPDVLQASAKLCMPVRITMLRSLVRVRGIPERAVANCPV